MKIEEHLKKFVELLKKLHINVPFNEALSHMPSYVKILKDILSNKRKFDNTSTVVLTKECSVIIQNKLAPKLKDPGSFSIPRVIGNTIIDRAICNIGASVSLVLIPIKRRGLILRKM